MTNKNDSGRRQAMRSRSRVATTADLNNALNQGHLDKPLTAVSDATTEADRAPRSSRFLKDLPSVGEKYTPKQPATKNLKSIIDKNYYTNNFEAAIKTVQSQHIPELKRIKTLNQFYYYVDELVEWIPEIRKWEWNGEMLHERTVYLRITQFYYYFNQRELEALQSPIDPQNGINLSPLSTWLREFAVEWGSFLDTENSAKYLSSFKYAPEFNWQDFKKQPEEYNTFNEFFAREFKNIDEQRPVASPKDDRTIVFPAESTFVGQWSVTTPVPRGAPLSAGPSIVVKHIEWPIWELLDKSDFASRFQGGRFCHSFLNTYDYHRMHTPVEGKVVEAKFIPGQVYLQVDLEKQPGPETAGDLAQAVIPRRYLDADDPTGYQFIQCRGLLVLETKNLGMVAVMPIGMAQVSSVVFTTPSDKGHKPILLTPEEKKGLTYEKQVEELNSKINKELVGKTLKKGEMFSYFQFGGSDCVVVFERKANVDITAKVGVHYPIRSRYGVANI